MNDVHYAYYLFTYYHLTYVKLGGQDTKPSSFEKDLKVCFALALAADHVNRKEPLVPFDYRSFKTALARHEKDSEG